MRDPNHPLVPTPFEINLMNRVRDAARASLDREFSDLIGERLAEVPYPEELDRRLAH